MFEIGRLIMKIAGRDSKKYAVIIDVLDNNYVLIDGQTRRRKCNINHIEPLDKILKIKKGATHSEVVSALKAEKIEVVDTKPKKKTPKPKKGEKQEVEEGKKEVKAKK